MKKGKNIKAKRRLLFISIVIVGLLAVLFGTVYNQFVTIIDNKRQIVELTKEYEDLLDDESRLQSEVTKMQNPDYIARYAKEKYLYSNEDEIIIRID